MKLTIGKLNLIQYQLRVNLLPVKETGLGYHINRNLVRIDKVVEEQNEVYKGIREKHTIKNEDGKRKRYKADKNGGIILDSIGKAIELPEDDMLSPFSYKVDTQSNEYKEEMKEWESTELEVELIKFPVDKVKECEKNNKFDGIDITSLIGVLMD